MFGREEAEELFEEKLYNDDERGEKKKHWLPKLVSFWFLLPLSLALYLRQCLRLVACLRVKIT